MQGPSNKDKRPARRLLGPCSWLLGPVLPARPPTIRGGDIWGTGRRFAKIPKFRLANLLHLLGGFGKIINDTGLHTASGGQEAPAIGCRMRASRPGAKAAQGGEKNTSGCTARCDNAAPGCVRHIERSGRRHWRVVIRRHHFSRRKGLRHGNGFNSVPALSGTIASGPGIHRQARRCKGCSVIFVIAEPTLEDSVNSWLAVETVMEPGARRPGRPGRILLRRVGPPRLRRRRNPPRRRPRPPVRRGCT